MGFWSTRTRDWRSWCRSPGHTFGGLTALEMIERCQIERVLAELAATYEGIPNCLVAARLCPFHAVGIQRSLTGVSM